MLLLVCGSPLGALRFNVHPQNLYGGYRLLAIGGLLAARAMILKQEEALLVVIGSCSSWSCCLSSFR